MDKDERALVARMLRGDGPNDRAARDLLLGRLVDADAYKETAPGDSNRDLNRWAALKVALAGLDVPWAFPSLQPSNLGLGNWRWREREGAKRAPGSQNIPCHENATKLYLAGLRGDRKARGKLLDWWLDWGRYMRDVAWMGDELMSREYGSITAEAAHAVLELLRQGGGPPEEPREREVHDLLDLYLSRWYFEHALRAVPWRKARMGPGGAKFDRTDLALSAATAGLRSGPAQDLRNQVEPMLALMLDWPVVREPRGPLPDGRRPWSIYPVSDAVAIAALATWRPRDVVLEAARERLERGRSPEEQRDAWKLSILQPEPRLIVTGYHTALLEDGGIVTWLDEDTNKETVPAIVYGIDRQGDVRSVYPLGGPPRPHRKVPRATVRAQAEGDSALALTVLQHPKGGGGEPRVFEEARIERVRGIDGRQPGDRALRPERG